ncbi:hypothetical protein [Roseimicrobium sp. ORNL1]|uniref:hypothetical protein n=1 Tax=Roseimicrobium sp. ORNL1 TaxID=2711231 RepID=UPI0013E1EA28|nr:hypothetical protein [Roseimicrobium sp. ORNL1]QIF05078.1 hypothetical protein G5S37_27385 [Roseimicrobium sp. ORNL1]
MSAASLSDTQAPQGSRKESEDGLIMLLAALLYHAGLLGFLLGQVVTFHQGFGVVWFSACGLLLLAGLVMPKLHVKITAVLLIAGCMFIALQERSRTLRDERQGRAHTAPARN